MDEGIPAPFFRQLFEDSPDGILLLDPDSLKAVLFNDAVCRQLGYSRDEFAALTIADYEAIESAGQVRAHAAVALRDGHTQFETLQRTKTGELRQVHVYARVVELAGKPVFHAVFRDVTERTRIEQALRHSATLLERTQRVAHVGHWSVDFGSGAAAWSGEARRIYGVEPETPASYATFLEIVHPGDRDRMQAWTADALAGRSLAPIEVRVIRPDGTERIIEGDGDVQFDASGQPLTMFGTVLDITERRHTSLALERSEAKFRTLFEAAQDAIFLMDSNVFVDCNRRTEELFGRPKAEIVGRSPLELSPAFQPDGRRSSTLAAARIAAAMAGEPQFFEWAHLRRDGTQFAAEVSLNRIDLDGQTFLQAIVRDVTERTRAEHLLRLQSAALNAAGDAIVITNRRGLIEWVNTAFTALTGYTLGESAGRTPGSVVGSGKHPPEFFKELWDTILSGRTWRGEIANKTKEGRLYTEEMAVTPIHDAAGAITHFVAIKEDITERLRLEAQLRQAQKLESVGQLASGIAHDFNNLLTVINGLTDLMLEQLDASDHMRADLNEIHAAGERAATLTRQLLAFSRQQLLMPKNIDLNDVVTGIEGLLQRLLGEDVEMVVALAPGVATVKADPGQIEQVITNLSVNARDAMVSGGRLTLETNIVTLEADEDTGFGRTIPKGRYVTLSVTDTGTGMDAATRAHLFEPFYTTKGPGRGTGLGLSTVYGIVRQSHGFVTLTSEVGEGSTFTVYLPYVDAGAAVPVETVARSARGSETVLVVEDNAGLSALARRFLERAGYSVLTAASGVEAIQVLQHTDRPIDLLLTDVVMPGMSGRELAEAVARLRPAIKVLYMSGYTNDAVVRHGVLDSTVAFIDKPFTASALATKVRATLDAPAHDEGDSD